MPNIRKINQKLREFLDLEVSFSAPIRRDPNIRFNFKRNAEEVLIHRLSSGEKALLHLIFSVHWSESRNIMLLIDEPELHLHPQFHRSFVAILRAAIQELEWQVIVATHSPGFLCEDFPGSLLCFRRLDGHSSVHIPQLNSDDKELIRLIDYDNSARILFARKVVLVEGPTDAFFFSHFLRSFAAREGVTLTKVDDVSFFATLGKGERSKWELFLNKLDILVFSISDLDAVLEIDSSLAKPISNRKTQQNINNSIKGKGSRDGLELYNSALILAKEVRTGNASLASATRVEQLCERIALRKTDAQAIIDLASQDSNYQRSLKSALDAALSRNHMILNQGELEDYIGYTAKGFDVITEFCRTRFNDWYAAPVNATKVAEIQLYIRQILGS